MEFSSPLLSEPMKEKNRKTGKFLAFLILGLVAFSICYILVAN